MNSVNSFYPAPYQGVSLQALLLEENLTKHGWLSKKSGGLARLALSLLDAYERRYFVIIKGWVYYYKDASSTKPQGQFSLEGYSKRVVIAEEEYESAPWVFKIFPLKNGGRTWYFSAENETKMQSWIESFRNEIEIYNIPRKLKINEIKFEDFLFKDLITINFFYHFSNIFKIISILSKE